MLSGFILLISINTVDNFTVLDLSTDRNDLMESSTNSPSINEQTDAYTFSQNDSITIQNTSNETVFKTTTATTSKSEISRGLCRALQVKVVTTYYGSDSSSSSGPSGGTIAGIVIGIIVLLCCCSICCGCYKKKSGHWETQQVHTWVEH
ncbi:unnamed protein product [Adineta steineri]|uniref:Uncharacterized protein n=1 Tax=Adineta steineri TaxID=433720 RepID=A0A815HM23_9BILA|nr:unnamed protein product [Adineta steineri]CAF1402906.1 unnamed protein product [Adineta steineri]